MCDDKRVKKRWISLKMLHNFSIYRIYFPLFLLFYRRWQLPHFCWLLLENSHRRLNEILRFCWQLIFFVFIVKMQHTYYFIIFPKQFTSCCMLCPKSWKRITNKTFVWNVTTHSNLLEVISKTFHSVKHFKCKNKNISIFRFFIILFKRNFLRDIKGS